MQYFNRCVNQGARAGELWGQDGKFKKTGKFGRGKVFGRKTNLAFDSVSLMWQGDNPCIINSRKYGLGF